MSKNFLWGFNSMAHKTLYTSACPEIIPTETEQKILAGAINSKFNELLYLKRKKEKITNILFRKQTVIPKDLLLIIQIKISKFAAIIKSALFECKATIFTGLSY